MSDIDRAADFQRRLTAALKGVTDIMDEANACGMHVEIGLGRDIAGRNCVSALRISKPLAW